ncbi:hypothetical protein UFOVP45_96 [uncultured Caudovirales phage]|uniref:Uncharacterized protein n=1 Tax=uncultured Caudovirales phage TaxID=2100421 RepID=A0A6J5KVB1_9CAUD|nr:hypothetical protein UFOVP45_96 [uncultured Caudovirales phage]
MSEVVSVQGVVVDKWAYTQAFNGGVGHGMTKERKRIYQLIDELVLEAQTLQYPNHEQYEAAYGYVKYKIEEKYIERLNRAKKE